MIELNTIIDNYSSWETPLDDRFGSRLCQFLTVEQCEKIGFEIIDPKKHKIKDWNETNVLEQLKKDVEFGWEKACFERGISSSLMVDVIEKWCKVLGNGIKCEPYEDYGKNFIHHVDKHYGWHLTDIDVSDGKSITEYALEQLSTAECIKLGGEE